MFVRPEVFQAIADPLHARQLGVSTYVAARFFINVITRPGTLESESPVGPIETRTDDVVDRCHLSVRLLVD